MNNLQTKKEILDYPWPPLPESSEKPVWTGKGFYVGGSQRAVLEYEVGSSGWTDELTSFHEETAGADHFIDKASRSHALQQLKKHLGISNPVALEIGCSSGFMLRLLRDEMPQAFLIGADYVSAPLFHLASEISDLPLLQFDLTRCPLPDESIDAVILLNVLEHIRDDEKALRQVHRILKPKGVAIIEVPAGPHLYDVYDKTLMHQRRYSLAGLRAIAEGAGFQVLEKSHLAFFLYPGFRWVKRRNRRLEPMTEERQKQIVARDIAATKESFFLRVLMIFELALGKWVDYPFGIRCLLTCGK